MKILMVDDKHQILTTIHLPGSEAIRSRIPVKGDYVCFNITTQPQLVDQEMTATDGIVEKVMIDYIQNLAIVTVKQS